MVFKLEGICRLLREVEKKKSCFFNIEPIGTGVIEVAVAPREFPDNNQKFLSQLFKKLGSLYDVQFVLNAVKFYDMPYNVGSCTIKNNTITVNWIKEINKHIKLSSRRNNI